MSRTRCPAFKFFTSKIFFPFGQETLGNCSLISRPTMFAMICSIVISAKFPSVIY